MGASENFSIALIDLPGGSRRLWSLALLRSAGFPFERLSALASPSACAIADAVSPTSGKAELESAERAFKEALAGVSAAIVRAAGDPLFQEALVWQNNSAFENELTRLGEANPERRNSDIRSRERTIASYLQRYCTKNDTIGFFGPLGWARVGEGSAFFAAQIGSRLLRSRHARLEHWAVEAVARHIGRLPQVRPHLEPHRVGGVRVEGSVVLVPGRPEPLSYYKCSMNSIVGDGVTIPWPAYTSRLDVEPELVVVYGNQAQPVAGYCIFNDVSARDVQATEFVGGFCLTKDMANGNQLGPYLVTRDEVGDPYGLGVTVVVNGQVRYQGSTSEISHKAEDVFAWLSFIAPLRPGTAMGFGTIPDCTGCDHDDFIDPGADIDIRIERLGSLRCRFAEPAGRLLPSRWPVRPSLQKYHR